MCDIMVLAYDKEAKYGVTSANYSKTLIQYYYILITIRNVTI